MKYIEVILAKDRKGRAVTSFRTAVENSVVERKETKVIESNYGHVIVLDFKTGKAKFWRPGTPGDRRTTEIIFHDIDEEK